MKEGTFVQIELTPDQYRTLIETLDEHAFDGLTPIERWLAKDELSVAIGR